MEDFQRRVEEYLKEHPDIEAILKQFYISQRDYERYIALTSPRPSESLSIDTSEGTYNAEVSGLSI